MKRWPPWLSALVVASCAGGGNLRPGAATQTDVLRTMGAPALSWQNADGSRQFSYPHGPYGFHSYMVYLDRDGRLQKIEDAMEMGAFARIQAGMSQAEVLRTLGPSDPAETAYFPARRELNWGWRYCDAWNNAAHFYVLFDKDSGAVQSTMSVREVCDNGVCYCGH